MNFILLAAISASAVGYGRTSPYRPDTRSGGHGWYEPIDLWRPYVDNPRSGVETAEPSCRNGVRDRIGPNLLWAPLPEGYEPRRMEPVFACIRLAGDGRVAAAWLLAPTSDAKMDDALLDLIRHRWVFAEGVDRKKWLRVRLSRPPLT